MPYADINQQREYSKVWTRNKRQRLRQEWIEANGPCQDCGGSESLEIHHKDPSQKKFKPSSLWTRKREVREAELDKCIVLCKDCHLKHTVPYLSEFFSAMKPANASLTSEQASEVKYLLTVGVRQKDIANKYGCSVQVIKDIKRGKTYKDSPVRAPSTTEIQERLAFA